MEKAKPNRKLNGKDTTDNASAVGVSRSPDDEFQTMVFKKFWQLTNRKNKAANISADDCSRWGTMHEIQEISATLKHVVNNGGVDNVHNLKQTFEMILKELDLGYKTKNMKVFESCEDKIVMYDIRSTPPWAFCGEGPSEESAKIAAARKGLEFFVSMSS